MKKWALTSLVFLIGSKAMAYIWLIIGIVVLVVGGVVYAGFKQVTMRIPPGTLPRPADQPENVVRISVEDQNLIEHIWVYDSLLGYALGMGGLSIEQPMPPDAPSTNQVYQLSSVSINSPQGFTLQYWMGVSNILHMATGNTITNLYGATISQGGGTTNSYSFTVAAGGQLVQFNYMSTNNPDATNNWGYTTKLLDDNTNAFVIEIDRTTNFVNWDPQFTSYPTVAHTVGTWTDTNAPAMKAFYRAYAIVSPNN